MNLSLLGAVEGLSVLAIAYIVIGILIALCSIFVLIARIILVVKYNKLNKEPNKAGYTAFAAARALLDGSGMADVGVKEAGFWKALFYGNHYSSKENTIYLRKNIAQKDTVMAVAMALQKVGVVVQERQGDKKTILRNKMQPFVLFAPILFIPIVLIGTALDFLVFGGTGVPTLVFTIIGILFYLAAFVFTLLNIPVENRANKRALEIMEQTNFLDEEEREKVKKAFKAYMISYISEFILSLLKLIQFILKLLLKIAASRK